MQVGKISPLHQLSLPAVLIPGEVDLGDRAVATRFSNDLRKINPRAQAAQAGGELPPMTDDNDILIIPSV